MKIKDILHRVITGAPEYASDVRCSNSMRQGAGDIRVIIMSSQIVQKDTLFLPKTTIDWDAISSDYLSMMSDSAKNSLYSKDLHAFSFNPGLTEVYLYKKEGDLRTPDAKFLNTQSFLNCFMSSTRFYVVLNGEESNNQVSHIMDKMSAMRLVNDFSESYYSNPSRYTFGLDWFVVAGKFVVLNITFVDKNSK